MKILLYVAMNYNHLLFLHIKYVDYYQKYIRYLLHYIFEYLLEHDNNKYYQEIEEVFQQKIPEELVSFRGGHENTRTLSSTEPVQELFIGDYNDCNLPLHCFYNEDIEKKVREFFRKDFEFFQQYGFNYSIPN